MTECTSLVTGDITATISEQELTMTNELKSGMSDLRPKYPDYANISARKKSFYQWSSDNNADPDTLSKAGFFFTGVGDCVKCFFCGGGLKNWQSGDEPWMEHARLYPKCDFVKCSGPHQKPTPSDCCVREIHSDTDQTFFSFGFSQAEIENDVRHVRENYDVLWEKPATPAHVPSNTAILHCRLKNGMLVHLWIHGMSANNSQLILKHLVDLKESRLTNYERFRQHELQQRDDNISNPLERNDPSTSSLNVENPIPNLVYRGSRYHLPPETLKLAIDEGQRQRDILREENRKLRDITVCKVCLDLQARIVFLPCGHLVTCSNCACRLSNCAVCRDHIQRKVLVHLYPI